MIHTFFHTSICSSYVPLGKKTAELPSLLARTESFVQQKLLPLEEKWLESRVAQAGRKTGVG